MTPGQRLSWRRALIVALDATVIVLALLAALAVRFPLPLAPADMAIFRQTALPMLAVYMAVFYFARVYRGVYYYSSFDDMLCIARGTMAAAALTALFVLFVRQGQFPRSVLLMQPAFAFLGVCGIRFGIRLGKTWLNMPRRYSGEETNVLLYGAGELGESLLRQMLKTPEANYRVVGFLDDDRSKWGLSLHGCPVLGGREALAAVLQRRQVDEIVIAIGVKRGELVRDVMERLRGLDLPKRPELKIAPSLTEMLSAPGRGPAARKVRPADLLNRGEVRLDEARIARQLRGKRVLVTGAGGTIGGELARQVLRFAPAELTLVEAHATSLFHIEGEARELAREAQVHAVLGDVRDRALVERVFAQHRPQVVLHAAAHKHVHQIEHNVQEGVLNNSLATHYLCDAAAKNGAEAFLLISTDKAVKPSSVMGATKRLAEIAATAPRSGGTRFMAVRFGNVLGSSGSVLPIFQKQLEQGGPLTVTHPDVRRFFMTVEEAVGLILQAVSLSKGGEIFVLKMGEPVRILDMAKSLILLSGLEPGKDVEIRFTGLKQGEKLNEELIEDPAASNPSEHSDILILRGENAAPADLDARLLDLEISARAADPAAVLRRLRELVPTFRPDAAHEATA
ncbi:MAG: polysaccharide biosynthesis protein [Elusimicrobia bacterium]|nr:polysaccharide biosynthesis protein [Elusimicrobiota bacterium]